MKLEKNSVRVFGDCLALSVIIGLSLLLLVASFMFVTGAPFLPVYRELFNLVSVVSALLTTVSILCGIYASR